MAFNFDKYRSGGATKEPETKNSGSFNFDKYRTGTQANKANEYGQYADAMKPARLMEVDTLKKEQAKKAQEKVTQKVMKDIGLDLASNTKRFGEYSSGVEQRAKAAEVERVASQSPYEKWYDKNVGNSFVGKSLDKLQGADRSVSNFKAGALDTGTLGLTQGIGREVIKKIPGGSDNLKPLLDDRLDSTSYKAGTYAGYVAPGVVADRAIVKLGGEALKRLPRLTQGFVRGAASGALDTAAQEGGDVAFREGKFDPLNVAIGAGAGGALGVALPLAGDAIGALYRKYIGRSRSAIPEQAAPEQLMLPASTRDVSARPTGRPVETPDVIYGQGKVEPFGLPEPNVAPPTTGRLETRVNPYVRKLEQLFEHARTLDMPPGREREYLEDVWSRMASRDDPGLDELIELAYPKAKPNRLTPDLAQRAREAQGRREVYGVPLKAKPLSERYNGGVTGVAADPVERVGRAPTINANPLNRRADVIDVSPTRPSKDVTPLRLNGSRANPVDDVEEILQSVQQPRVRDRVVSFLDEQEKAALARIAKRKNNLSANPLDEWADHAIVMAAQLGKGTIKAADFTEELVKRFGESARPHAQTIYNKTKEVLRQNERKASKEGQEATAFNESGVGNADTFGQKVSTKSADRKTPFKARWEKLRTQFTDDLAPLEGLEKRVTGAVASAEDSLYKSARMFKGVPEKAAQTVEKRLTPIIESVEKSGYTSSDLGKYALAVHAKDVNASGIKSGFTNAEIDDVIRKFGTSEMEAARKQLVQVNKDMMKELVNTGVVSKELANVLDDRWKNYIPLFRAFDDDKVDIGNGLSNALANVASPIKTLKGSTRQVIDPLENMVKNIYQSTQAAERNKVASQLHRLNEIDTDNKYIRELNKNEEVGRKNVVNVKVNGENVKYEVEPEVYKALLNLDNESSSTLMNWLSKPASLLRAGATLTPEFSLRNPMRDVIQAFVVSKSGFNPITDFGAGLIQTISKGKLHKEWVENLGAYGNVMSMDRDVHRQALEKVLKESASKKFFNIVNGKSLIRALRYITDTTESATKVGEYRAALRRGATPQEAAYRSRDIMDFGRAGTSIRQANKVVAFLNANIQGKSKLIRSIKENPVGTVTRAFTAVTVPTIGIFVMNKKFANETQKETIKNSPEWMKNSFWLMAIPGTDVVARIPKPFDLAAIFSNLPEKALEYTYNNDKEAFDGFAGRALKDSSLPMQISGLLPLVEGMAGYSFFKEGDIVPLREQTLKKSDQYDPIRTTETGKWLAKGVEKLNGGKGAFGNFASPRVMDNTIQGLTAGLGKYATDAVDSILQGMIPFTGKKVAPALINRPPAPEKSLEQKPLLRSFLVDPNQGGKIMDKFYTDMDKLSRENASNKLNEVTFGGTKKKPLYLEKEKQHTLDSLNDASGLVSDINKEIRTVERSMTLTPKQKREQIDELTAERMKIIKDSSSVKIK